jgi:hypothetical protein
MYEDLMDTFLGEYSNLCAFVRWNIWIQKYLHAFLFLSCMDGQVDLLIFIMINDYNEHLDNKSYLSRMEHWYAAV